MKENILLVYPTKKQLEYLQKKYSGNMYYVVSHKKIDSSNVFVNIAEDEIINIPTNVRVLCCHEEGIFWLKCNWRKGWRLQFSEKLFSLILKDCFKKYLLAIGVDNTWFCDNMEQIKQFPIVIKPVIGFGSIGVKKINNEIELENLIKDSNLTELLESINPYKNKYFSVEQNGFIFEQYISGDFFRVPFIMQDGEVKYLFPVKGNNTTYKENSDFHWTEFELGKVNEEIVVSMKVLLTKLTNDLHMKVGVFVAEFLIDKNNKVYLLEMSPRQTSSRICKMIEYYSGIDLEVLAIDLFFSKADISFGEKQTNIKMQLFRKKLILDNDFEVLEKVEEVSVYGDKITTVYSERVV